MAKRTQVCLVEKGKLSNAVVLDIGHEDFLNAISNLPAGAELSEQAGIAERFSQDIRSVLESFDYGERVELPVLVLSDGSSVIDSIVSCLKYAGINAKAVIPEIKSLRSQGEFGIAQLYEYRLPIGLALMAFERSEDGLNLFVNLYDPSGMKKRSSLYSLKIAAVIAAALLTVLVMVSYGLDVAENKRLSRLVAQPDFKGLFEQQALIENIARQRPDLLQLLSDINSGENRGIQLDNFYFRKGQPVTIGGEAQSNDQLYDFQKYLLSKKGITDVNIQNTSTDSRTKRLRFTITFNYKTFTKKSTQTQSRKSELL
jgi:hypothetical protein